MLTTRRLATLALLLWVPACSGGDDPPATVDAGDRVNPNCSGFVGDEAQPLEMEMIVKQLDGSFTLARDGDVIPISTPPQGGKMIFPGVRARNLDTCGVQLTGAIRDQCTGRLLHVEGRPVNLKVGDDGWAVPTRPEDISNYSNLPVCPNINSTRHMFDEPYVVELTMRDRTGRMATRSHTLTLACAVPEEEATCRCECQKDYVLGTTCDEIPDAGAPPGSCP